MPFVWLLCVCFLCFSPNPKFEEIDEEGEEIQVVLSTILCFYYFSALNLGWRLKEIHVVLCTNVPRLFFIGGSFSLKFCVADKWQRDVPYEAGV